MAEVFGIAAAALSVAGLFNNAIDLFERVQSGRNYETDYETCQLRLQIARLRLSRWGAAVNIENDARFAVLDPRDDAVRTTKHILEQLVSLFSVSYMQSGLCSPVEESGPTSPRVITDETEKLRSLNAAQTLYRRYRKKPSLSRRISWSLYKQKHFSRLLDDIQELLQGLETAFPPNKEYYRLMKDELDAFEDADSIRALSEAAAQTDEPLRLAAKERLYDRGNNNTVDAARVSGFANLKVGEQVLLSEEYSAQGEFGKTTNTIKTLDADGNSTILVGNTYGLHPMQINLLERISCHA